MLCEKSRYLIFCNFARKILIREAAILNYTPTKKETGQKNSNRTYMMIANLMWKFTRCKKMLNIFNKYFQHC